MLQDLQWDGCRKETDYYEKSYVSRRNSDFRDAQVDIKDNSWSVEAGLRVGKVAEWQGYGIGLEKQYYMLRNVEDAALCVNITKYAEMMEH